MEQRREVDASTRELQAPSSAHITAAGSDPRADISAERRRASFAYEPLMYVLNGGKAKVERR